MKISYSWLKEYINTDLTAENAAEILTAIGLEIEGIEKVESIKGGLSGLVVAEVLTCQRHPDADKLNVTTVTTGAGEVLQVVCGAPNVMAGQKVVLAPVGTVLYPLGSEETLKIKKSKIRGVESFGMLCAEDEIGLGTSHDGIIVLDDAVAVGTPAAEVFEMQDDYIMEVGLTPNRVDAASHYGVARDLAAYLRMNAALPEITIRVDESLPKPRVRVENADAAPRYMGLTITGLTIKPSPEWLQTRLRAVGINPKNNVVDITNFVLHECGQPLHAFDLAKVEGEEIVVRNCPDGTPFVTLDGVERKLSSEDLMICSATRPMCLAGVFGGMDSGVSDMTTSIFIESAYFNPVSIRKSAKRHGLSTDASFRYERGADPNIAPYALLRAASLVLELAGGEISSSVIDLYPQRVEDFKFQISLKNINALIGKEIPEQTVREILCGLEIEITSCCEQEGTMEVSVPAYRVDVRREADLIEDILRIYGFNNVENPHIVKNVITYGNQHTTDRMVDIISDMLSSLGCTEIMSNSLTRSTYYSQRSLESAVKILNPLSQELNAMRQTLLFNALEAIELNSNRRNADLKLYEVGNCYFYDAAKADHTLRAYSQEQRLGIAITGLDEQPSWNAKASSSNFFTIKALVEKIFDRLGLNINEGVFENSNNEQYSESLVYTIRGGRLFEIGIVAKKTRAVFDIKAPVYFMEMNVEKLHKLVNSVRVQVVELAKYQSVKRDLALLVDIPISFSKLREVASRAEKKLIKNITLFDVYEGDKLPEGKKSYALSFTIEDTTKTLTDSDIERVMTSIMTALERQCGAVIRS